MTGIEDTVELFQKGLEKFEKEINYARTFTRGNYTIIRQPIRIEFTRRETEIVTNNLSENIRHDLIKIDAFIEDLVQEYGENIIKFIVMSLNILFFQLVFEYHQLSLSNHYYFLNPFSIFLKNK